MQQHVEEAHHGGTHQAYHGDVVEEAVVGPILSTVGIGRAVLEEGEVATQRIGHPEEPQSRELGRQLGQEARQPDLLGRKVLGQDEEGRHEAYPYADVGDEGTEYAFLGS